MIAQLISFSQLRDTIDMTFNIRSYQSASHFFTSLNVVSVSIPSMKNVPTGSQIRHVSTRHLPPRQHRHLENPQNTTSAHAPLPLPQSQRPTTAVILVVNVPYSQAQTLERRRTAIWTGDEHSGRDSRRWKIGIRGSQAKTRKTTRERGRWQGQRRCFKRKL